MNEMKLALVVTDLDGTLFTPEQRISEKDFQTLKFLGEQKIYRVIATGRTLFSAQKVLPDDFPIDFLIFSTGAGVIHWQSKEIIYARSLNSAEVSLITKTLIRHQIDFMVLNSVPDSHFFSYYRTSNSNPDFDKRIELYQHFARPLSLNSAALPAASEILITVPDGKRIYDTVINEFPQFKIIRTTSPINGNTMWIEIFPEDVSKGHAAAWLCQKLQLEPADAVGIGNDYNDIDLLNWTSNSYIMANAPEELKAMYHVTADNSNNGFTKAIMKIVELPLSK